MDIGLLVTDYVLQIAALLIYPSAPGYVALSLIASLLLMSIFYNRQVARNTKAIKWITEILSKPKTAAQFTFQIDDIDRAISVSAKNMSRRQVLGVWQEYRETLLIYGDTPNQLLRNSVRPSTFINIEDLQMGAGFWRIIPGLFVSIGLFLTFLGLVAALAQTQNLLSDPDQAQTALKGLVGTASAKFIMSLTGLACSILFTAHLRAGIGKVERSIHRLCVTLEKRLPYISLEEVSVAQLSAMKSNHSVIEGTLEKLNLSLQQELGRIPMAISEISTPFKNEVPEIIAKSITTSLEPILNKVLEMSTLGVGDLVKTLSNQLTGDIGTALTNASLKITDAGNALSAVAGQMNGNSSTLTERLSDTINNLATTLEGIRSAALASSENAKNDMQLAGQAARDLMSDAGQNIAVRFEQTAGEVAQLSQNLTQRMTDELLAPMSAVCEKLQQMNQEISQSSSDIRRLNDGIRLGADQATTAAAAFRSASENFQKYAAPVTAGADRNEATVAKMQSSVAALERAVVMALGVAESGLQAINGTLESVSTITGDFARQADRLDTMDETLGRAFERYGVQVEGALDMLRTQIADLRAAMPTQNVKV